MRRWPSASWVIVGLLVILLTVRLLSPPKPSDDAALLDGGPHDVERIIDGDTLLMAGGHRVRLIGVDTPETKHPDQPVDPLGEVATLLTRELIGSQPVLLEFDRQRRDRYHRLLAYVWVADGRLLNEELVRSGLSPAQTQYPYRQDMKRRFVTAEQEARAARRGMWAEPVAVSR